MLRRLATALLIGVTVTAALVIPESAALADDCSTYTDSLGIQHVVCVMTTTDPGTTAPPTTTQQDPSNGDNGSGGSGDNGSSDGDPGGFVTYDEVMCVSAPSAQATADLATVKGTRTLTSVQMYCESDINGGPGFYFWSTSAVAPPPPVDIVGLSRKARADITIPKFSLEFGPDATRLAVNMQTTFTAVPDRSINLGASEGDRGITVTVTGHLKDIEWSPGEPAHCKAGDKKAACSGGQVEPVDCSGTACQYTYRWMSRPARTGGAPVWTVTATATWQFAYTTTGTGATTGPTTDTWTEPIPAGTATVSMGEWSTAGGYEG